ncbi:MAG: hypothetical protein A2V70_10095 [Planctomycetes bacterium RBG_13_63_9]|nr:MAG: hypothetical protein A2V70_10095 [Planctomycetes bacterium RBG_13_63_9]
MQQVGGPRTESTTPRFWTSAWAIVAVLALATMLRLLNVTHWSLWEDEETSLAFSQNLDKWFPSHLPFFFHTLSGLFQVTGVSVAAGRILSAMIGVFDVWLLYVCVRKFVSREVALVAMILMTINLGHLFWSQSIRYYTTVLAFELLSIYWFLDGFERGNYWALLLSNLALAAALFTHHSAILLAPVFVGYLALTICRRENCGAYNVRGYLLFGISFAVVVGLFAGNMLSMRQYLTDMSGDLLSVYTPVHILITIAAYFGLPLVALGLLAPLAAREVPTRILLFFLVVAVVPVMELLVLAQLRLGAVTWYYGFVALAGFATLAAMSLVSLYRSGSRRVATVLGSAAVVYYGVFLLGYYTTMHGDRPRWKEATAALRQALGPDRTKGHAPEIYATVPGVVAHYLGVDPADTMGNVLVKGLPKQPSAQEPSVDQWYVVKQRGMSDEYARWLDAHCELKDRFEARTGPVDRSVLLYFRPGRRPTA